MRVFSTLASLFFCIFLITQSASALTIISPHFEISLDPGTEESGFVKLYNETSETVVLTPTVEIFTQGDTPGQPVYVPSDSESDHTNWFILENDELQLEPGQVAAVPFTVEVPETAAPGGYYAALFWQTQPQDLSAGVAISGRVGALVFLTVLGEVSESAQSKLIVDKNIAFELPLSITANIENTGSIHMRPKVTATVRTLFNKIHTLQLNQNNSIILPGTQRQFTTVWGDSSTLSWWQRTKQEFNLGVIGPVDITLQTDFGVQEQQSIQSEARVWFFPWRMLVTVAVFLLGVVAFFKVNNSVKRLKKKKTNAAK